MLGQENPELPQDPPATGLVAAGKNGFDTVKSAVFFMAVGYGLALFMGRKKRNEN